MLKAWHKSKKKITCSKHSNFKSGQSLFFLNIFIFYQMCTIPFENLKDFNIDD
jgi:arylamine N-acetyltransferase